MRFIDTHAHYNDVAYNDILNETLKKVKDKNVDYVVNVGYNKSSSIKAIELSEMYDYMYSAIGVHPHDVFNDTCSDVEKIYNTCKNTNKILAIGEIGLDYAFVKDNKQEQINLFIDQIHLANELKLPVIIHTRDASLDTYKVLSENKPKYGAILHCFKPSDDLMKLVINDGYYVGFGGNITYKRSKSFANYIKQIPISQIVLETDCPYLAPIPFKGSINDSSNLPVIITKLAEYLETEKEYLSQIVYNNSLKFYKIKK